MFGRKRALAPKQAGVTKLPGGWFRRAVVYTADERGGAMLELAYTLPVLLLMVTGFVSIGTLLEQDMQLTDAVNVAAKELAISRGNTTDPCNLVYGIVTTAAPYLTASSMSFSFSLNGSAYSGSSCSSGSTTTGAAGNLIQGDPVTVTVTYPCSLSTYFGVLAPSGSYFIQSQLTEMVQ